MFTRFFKWLFCACQHKWAILNQAQLVRNSYKDIPHGIRYTLQCEKCGWIKSKTIS